MQFVISKRRREQSSPPHKQIQLQAKSKRRKKLDQMLRERELYLLLLPAITLAILFKYVPMYGTIIAFKDYNPILGILGSEWIGFANFKKFFSSIFFERVFWNTIIINALQLAFAFPMPIIFALFLNEIKGKRFKKSVQTISYLPHFLSWVIIGGFIVDLLSPTSGTIASIATTLGFSYDTAILAEAAYFRQIVVLSSIWKTIGWGSIVYLAAISAIDLSLYEAADIDGAGRFRKMWSITLPELTPTIATMFILRVGQIMTSDFEQILVLYSPTVYSVGDVISTYIYREGVLSGATSYATAVGLFQSVIGFALVLLTNKICRKLGNSLW